MRMILSTKQLNLHLIANAAELSFERGYNFGHVRGLWNMQHMEFSHPAFTWANFPLILVRLPVLPVIIEVERALKNRPTESLACRVIYSLQSECFILAWCLLWLADQPRSCEACPCHFLAWPLRNVFSFITVYPVISEREWRREEMQTHGRKESSWELSLKHSIKLLCNNVSETEELMQKAGSVGAPEWETVSPSCGTHKGFTVVHKCDVAKTQNTGFPLHH